MSVQFFYIVCLALWDHHRAEKYGQDKGEGETSGADGVGDPALPPPGGSLHMHAGSDGVGGREGMGVWAAAGTAPEEAARPVARAHDGMGAPSPHRRARGMGVGGGGGAAGGVGALEPVASRGISRDVLAKLEADLRWSPPAYYSPPARAVQRRGVAERTGAARPRGDDADNFGSRRQRRWEHDRSTGLGGRGLGPERGEARVQGGNRA